VPMDPAWVIDRLESNVSVFQGQLRLVRSTQATWKPAADEWSIVEVVNHLAEEESDDFRMRLRLLLEDPNKEWPDIDPERSVAENRFNSRDLQESLHRFTRERSRSVEWLKTLPQVNWHAAHNHPKLGSLRAGDLLCSWLAHDLIHIRQINRLHYEYQAITSPEFSAAYGGNW
jgi:hypothetical protein